MVRDGTHTAETDEEKDAVYRFRYEIYVAEMGRYDSLRKQVLSSRSGLLVGSNDPQDALVFNLRIPRNRAGRPMPPGRGYLVRRGQAGLGRRRPGAGAACGRHSKSYVRRVKKP